MLDACARRGVTHLAMEASSLGHRPVPARRRAARRSPPSPISRATISTITRPRRLSRGEDAPVRGAAAAPGIRVVVDADSDVRRRASLDVLARARAASPSPSARRASRSRCWRRGRRRFATALRLRHAGADYDVASAARRGLPDFQRAGRGGARHRYGRRARASLLRAGAAARRARTSRTRRRNATARRSSSTMRTNPTRWRKSCRSLRPLAQGAPHRRLRLRRRSRPGKAAADGRDRRARRRRRSS